MMRINLFAESDAEEPQAQPAGSPAAFQASVFAAAFGAAAILLSAAWWLVGVWQTRLDSQMAIEKSEANRLAGVAAENKRYDSELQEINRRIAAVQALEDNRRGPVTLLTSLQEAVSRAPALNLLSVGPKDGRLALNGAASSVTALADLVAALESSQGYQDVLLREYHEDDMKSGAVRFKFALDFMFQPPAPAMAATSPTAAVKPTGAAPAARPQPVVEKPHG
jgi:Tfp pilus assembly protein PilN